jgi:hypothetical protein
MIALATQHDWVFQKQKEKEGWISLLFFRP